MAASTYTENSQTVLDQKVILGEQYLPTYTTGYGAASSTATASSHLLEIMAGASLNVRILQIKIYQYQAATTAALMSCGIYRLSSAGSSGSAAGGPTPLNPSDPAAGATALALPSSKGTETVQVDFGMCYMMQTIAASAQLNQPILAFDYDFRRGTPLIIPAGVNNGIAIKNSAVAGALVVIIVSFRETSF